ncbi:hypothetical protein JOM56_006923 [Amanita muscaria]
MSTNYGLELQHRTSPLQIFYSSCSTKLLSLVGIRIGHHVAALKGALPPEQRLHYRAARSKLPGHPEFSLTPGVKFSSVSVTRQPRKDRVLSWLRWFPGDNTDCQTGRCPIYSNNGRAVYPSLFKLVGVLSSKKDYGPLFSLC